MNGMKLEVNFDIKIGCFSKEIFFKIILFVYLYLFYMGDYEYKFEWQFMGLMNDNYEWHYEWQLWMTIYGKYYYFLK